MDSDDDIYEPNESTHSDPKPESHEVKMEDADEDVEEGEEEEDSSDDDINFITDAKVKTSQPAPESSSQQKAPRSSFDAPKPSSTPQPVLKSSTPSQEKASTPQPSDSRPGTDYPARHTSTLSINGNPIYPYDGKPIQSTDFDVDFPTESSKPWRRPGSDITDYFNYGFDEFTWASWCLKAQTMPKEIKEINAQAEQMKAFVEGIPGGGAVGTGAGPAALPGMPDDATMMQMMQSMMASGMDMTQMDPAQMMQMMMGGPGAMGPGMGAQQGGAAGFQAPTGPQAGNYGGGGGGYGGGGGFGGRGRGRRGR